MLLMQVYLTRLFVIQPFHRSNRHLFISVYLPFLRNSYLMNGQMNEQFETLLLQGMKTRGGYRGDSTAPPYNVVKVLETKEAINMV